MPSALRCQADFEVDPGLHNKNPAAAVRAHPIDLAESRHSTGEVPSPV